MIKAAVGGVTRSLLVAALLVVSAEELPCWGKGGEAVERSFGGKRAVVVVLNGVSWADIEQSEVPTLEGLVRLGSIGLLSTRTFAFDSQEGAFETLGAGSRAVSLSRCADALSRWERYQGEAASGRYERLSHMAADEAAVLVPQIEGLREDNERLRYLVRPGLLGEALASAGLSVAVLGNEDTSLNHDPSSLHREAVAIAMDSQGKVGLGDVGKDLLLPDARLGVATNGPLLVERFKECYQRASLIVVDLGDTGRALRRRGFGSGLLRASLEREDRNLRLLLEEVDWSRTRLYLLSPTADMTGNRPFAPIIVSGVGVSRGVLSSATTRQRGLVCNIDLLPSILEFLDISFPPLLYGRQMCFGASSGERLGHLMEREEEAAASLLARPILVAALVLCVFLGLALALVSLRYPVLTTAARLGLGFSLGFVFGVVAVPALLPMRYGLFPLVGVVVLVAVATPLMAQRRAQTVLVVLGASMFLLLCADQLLGADLTLDTILGSQSAAARRFYGLGNSLMAFLLASCLLFLPLLLHEHRRLGRGTMAMVVVLFVGTIVLVGGPTLGANVGGVLTVGTTFALAFFLLARGRIGWQGWAAAFAVAVAFLALCLLLDVHRPASAQTHLGRNIAFLEQGGLPQVGRVVANKLSQNVAMLMATPFTVIFIPIFLAMFYAVLRPSGIFQRLFSARPYFHHCLKAGMFGSVIGALTNDSGIVIALLIFSLLAPATFLLALTPQMDEEGSGPS